MKGSRDLWESSRGSEERTVGFVGVFVDKTGCFCSLNRVGGIRPDHWARSLLGNGPS